MIRRPRLLIDVIEDSGRERADRDRRTGLCRRRAEGQGDPGGAVLRRSPFRYQVPLRRSFFLAPGP